MILVSCGCSRHVSRSSSSDNPPVESSNTPVPTVPPVESSSDTPVPTVPPVSSSSEEPSSSAEQRSYTITWQNYDGSVLEIDYNVPHGTMPSYDYETPRHPCDPNYAAKYYIFSGWTPTVVPATADATYVATFTESSTPANVYTITWKNYDGTTFYTSTCGEGATPTYAGDTPRKPSSDGKYYVFNGWDPTPVPAYSNATYTATFTESTTPPEPAVWPTNDVNTVITNWGAPADSFPPFADERITSFTASLNGAGDTLKVACNGMSLNEGKAVFSNYVSSNLGSFTPDTTLVSGQTVYIDPTNHFYIGYDNNYPSIFRLMAVKYSAPVSTTYTVTWKDADDTVLETDSNVAYGATPSYDGATPSFHDPYDLNFEYYFTGWDKELNPVTADVTFTAQYETSPFIMEKKGDIWEVTGLYNKNYSTMISVPSKFYDGAKVTRIADGAFKDCSKVPYIIVSMNVTYIGEGAFAGMKSLRKLDVPFIGRTVESTGEEAVLGYFFGTTPVDGMTAITQEYSLSGTITRYIPDSLYYIRMTGGFIHYGAFFNCTNISEVYFAGTVSGIGQKAFYNSGVINVDASQTAIRMVDDYAFGNCKQLKSFKTSDKKAISRTMEVGYYLFNGCSALESLSIPLYGHLGTLFSMTEFEGSYQVTVDGNTYYIPSSLTTFTDTGGILSTGAFENTTLTTINITDEVLLINAEALKGANSLVNLTLPYVGIDSEATEPSFDALFGAIFSKTTYGNGITYGAHQQYDSSHYTYNYIPNSLKNVTVTGGDLLDYAFSDVNKIETVTLDGAKSVGSKAFYHCSADISLNEGLETIADHAFNYSDMDTDLVIPDSVTSIGEFAFSSANSITSIIVGANVETIGKSAFNHCDSATSITFKGNKVKTIQSSTFNHCGSLTKIVIPEGVTEIDSQAFDYCSSLSDVTLPSTLTDLKAASIFSHNEVLTTIKFNGTVAQWNAIQKASNWISSTCPNVTTIVCSDGNVSL